MNFIFASLIQKILWGCEVADHSNKIKFILQQKGFELSSQIIHLCLRLLPPRAATALQGQGTDSSELTSAGIVPASPQKVSPNLSLEAQLKA